MDRVADVSEMLASVSELDVDSTVAPVLFTVGDFSVREMNLGVEKVAVLWTAISKFRTLFSDLTKGDVNNFLRFLAEGSSFWLEIYKHDEFIGIVCLTKMHKVVDTDAHVIFFDRKLADKAEICRKIVVWVFGTFPLQRITVEIPRFYYATIRLVTDIGFKIEGEKRNAVLIEGRWSNVLVLGITRTEAEKL